MLKKIALLFLAWKVIIFTFVYLASRLIPSTGTSDALEFTLGTPYLNWVFANFDGIHYLSIAKFGYSYPNYAFFPLLPMLLFFLYHYLSIPYIEAGLLISNISLFLSLFMVYKIIRLDFDDRVATRSLILLLAFPVAFFLAAVYTDSLYLLLSTASFYFARKSRWLPAGVLGFLAGMTRLVGIILVFAFLFEWYQQNVKSLQKLKNLRLIFKTFVKKQAYFIFLIPFAVISYSIYLQITQGDFLLFQKAMAAWGQQNTVFPLQVVFRYIKIFLTASRGNILYYIAILEFMSTFFYLFLAWYVMRYVRVSYGVFMFATILLPTFTGTLQSMPRYLLHLFPGFLAISLLLAKWPKKLYAIVIAVFILLQCILVALYTRGYFVA